MYIGIQEWTVWLLMVANSVTVGYYVVKFFITNIEALCTKKISIKSQMSRKFNKFFWEQFSITWLKEFDIFVSIKFKKSFKINLSVFFSFSHSLHIILLWICSSIMKMYVRNLDFHVVYLVRFKWNIRLGCVDKTTHILHSIDSFGVPFYLTIHNFTLKPQNRRSFFENYLY